MRIRSILTERLDHVRLHALFKREGRVIKLVLASTADRPDQIDAIGLAAATFAGTLLPQYPRPDLVTPDEMVIVGAEQRAFIFSYGQAFLVVIAKEAIGDVCYHCRWDQTEVFGIHPHIRAAGLETELLTDHSNRLRQSEKRCPTPTQGADSRAFAARTAEESVAIESDLRCDLLLNFADDGAWAAAAAGRIKRDASHMVSAMSEFRSAGMHMAATLDRSGFGLGSIREIIASCEPSRWEEGRSALNAGVLIIARDDLQLRWVGVFTHERLGRALFSVRRCFRSESLADDYGRPHIDDILNKWYVTGAALGHRYSSGVFYQREKLWVGADAQPSDILEAEIPDVAGSLIDCINQCPLAKAIPGSYWPITEISVELLNVQNDHADRRLTLLIPLRADLFLFASAGGIATHVRDKVLASADDLRSAWLEARIIARRPPAPTACPIEPGLPKNIVSISVTAEGRELQRPATFACRPSPQICAADVEQLNAQGLPAYLVDVAHRLVVLVFVMTKHYYGWNGAIKVGNCAVDLKCMPTEEGCRRFEITARFPLAISNATAIVVNPRRPWVIIDYLRRGIVEDGSRRHRILSLLLNNVGRTVSLYDLQAKMTGKQPAASRENWVVSRQLSTMLYSLRDQVNDVSTESNLELQLERRQGGLALSLCITNPLSQAGSGALHSRSPAKLFYSYAHEDEALLQRLDTALKMLERDDLIKTWHDRRAEAGNDWQVKLQQQLRSADVILLLISPDFIGSDYCYKIERSIAMERHAAGVALVIPVILRKVHGWQSDDFAKLKVLPKDGLAVTLWKDQDEAFADVAEGIRHAIEAFRRRKDCSSDWSYRAHQH